MNRFVVFVMDDPGTNSQVMRDYPTAGAAVLAAQGFGMEGKWVRYGAYLCRFLNDSAARDAEAAKAGAR